jgi:hypothetical protein
MVSLAGLVGLAGMTWLSGKANGWCYQGGSASGRFWPIHDRSHNIIIWSGHIALHYITLQYTRLYLRGRGQGAEGQGWVDA